MLKDAIKSNVLNAAWRLKGAQDQKGHTSERDDAQLTAARFMSEGFFKIISAKEYRNILSGRNKQYLLDRRFNLPPIHYK